MTDRIRKIIKETNHLYLNMYKMWVSYKNGKEGSYYLASRTPETDDLEVMTGKQRVNGVNIFSVYGEKKDRVVLVKQFRYTIGTYIYEFPAGLVEEGEDYHDTAVRELREETGLCLHPVKADPVFERGYYTTVGMTDENCATVYGYADGEITEEFLEGSEDIETVLAGRDEILRILREERVSLSCAYMLMHFLSAEKPFDFLQGAKD